MTAILSPMAVTSRPTGTSDFRTPGKKEIVTGKISNEPVHNELLNQKLCDRCLNGELSITKCKDEAARIAKDQQEHQKYLDKLRKEEEQLRREKNELLKKQREEMVNFAASKFPKKPKDNDTAINKELSEKYEKMQREADIRKSIEKKEYKDQLKQQMIDKKNAKQEARRKDNEAMFTGLNISGSLAGRSKIDPSEYRRALQDQINEKHKKRNDNEEDKEAQMQMDNLSAQLINERLKAELEKKKTLKGGYDAFLQDQERKAREAKLEKAKDLEDLRKQKEHADQEQQEQRMRDLEKQRELNDYLINQIKERANKRKTSTSNLDEMPIEEKSVKPIKDNTIAMDNLKLIQERANIRAMEREKERKEEEEYLRHQKQLQEQERLNEAKKKADQKKFLGSADIERAKKDRELQEKLAKQRELDYYESLNDRMKEMIAKDSELLKAKMENYRNVLDSQIAEHDTAKRAKREQDMKDRLNTGLNFDRYKRSPHYDIQKYREDLKQQWKDDQEKKAKGNKEAPEDYAKMKEFEEAYDQKKLKEELSKRSEMMNDYKKAMELKDKQKEDGRKKELDEQKQLEEARKIDDRQKDLKNVENNQKKADLRNALKTQLEDDRKRRQQEKNERNQWFDYDTKKRIRELERKMSNLKEEIERCIKCNDPISGRLTRGKKEAMKF